MFQKSEKEEKKGRRKIPNSWHVDTKNIQNTQIAAETYSKHVLNKYIHIYGHVCVYMYIWY